MEKENTFTITGWDASECESIHEELKEFAQSLGWEETVDDGEGNQVPNPKSYEELIFVDKPMEGFWEWLEEHRREEEYASVRQAVRDEVTSLKNQVTIGVE